MGNKIKAIKFGLNEIISGFGGKDYFMLIIAILIFVLPTVLQGDYFDTFSYLISIILVILLLLFSWALLKILEKLGYFLNNQEAKITFKNKVEYEPTELAKNIERMQNSVSKMFWREKTHSQKQNDEVTTVRNNKN